MHTLLRGLGIGLAIGASPGPVLILVLTQSFQHGMRGGLSVAAASALATVPVVLVSLCFQLALRDALWAQHALTVAGIFFLLYAAYDALRAPAITIDQAVSAGRSFSFGKGFLATVLFPIPYLFWSTVGIPLSYSDGAGFSVLGLAQFVGGFVIALFAVNAVLAILVSRFGRALPLGWINGLCRFTAVLFAGFAVSMARGLLS